jgi:hypothetical protein
VANGNVISANKEGQHACSPLIGRLIGKDITQFRDVIGGKLYERSFRAGSRENTRVDQWLAPVPCVSVW